MLSREFNNLHETTSNKLQKYIIYKWVYLICKEPQQMNWIGKWRLDTTNHND